MNLAAPLRGLVLCGGASRRMGRDKGQLVYGGVAAALRSWRLLNSVCVAAFVSVRKEQAELDVYAGLPQVVDTASHCGPAAGLLAAWEVHPDGAWLALAVDMPFVDEGLLTTLVRYRAPTQLATAFRHPSGTLEPLCTIWEPAARDELARRAAANRYSLRELLEEGAVGVLEPSEPRRLASVNSPEHYARVLEDLG